MNPWNRVLNYGRDINRKIGNTLTTEKAKKIRKNLIVWGVIITIISGIGLVFGVYKMFSGFLNIDTGTSNNSNNNNDEIVCPSMGQEGWFECESNKSKAEFNASSNNANNIFKSTASSAFSGFGIVAIAGLVLSFGVMMIYAGLAIVVVGEGAKFIDTAPKCPKCGDPIESNEIYCNKCGADLRNKTKCASCGTQNEVNDKFCRNCGKEL